GCATGIGVWRGARGHTRQPARIHPALSRDPRGSGVRAVTWPLRRYRFLVRAAGRGRSTARLADVRGEVLCGLRLGDRWALTTTAPRTICQHYRAGPVAWY